MTLVPSVICFKTDTGIYTENILIYLQLLKKSVNLGLQLQLEGYSLERKLPPKQFTIP